MLANLLRLRSLHGPRSIPSRRSSEDRHDLKSLRFRERTTPGHGVYRKGGNGKKGASLCGSTETIRRTVSTSGYTSGSNDYVSQSWETTGAGIGAGPCITVLPRGHDM